MFPSPEPGIPHPPPENTGRCEAEEFGGGKVGQRLNVEQPEERRERCI